MRYSAVESPRFLPSLVVYEVATKHFTSPDGPESGTFRSLRDKMCYLQELGITGIWLSGHQLCDASHSGGWCQYAVLRPDQLDPSLGTEQDFRDMIEEAHRKGIRVFLDVITHGVCKGSELITMHPDWFSGGTWGMVDFDWYGGNKELDQWWIDMWVDYVVRFGVDGYRLDVAHYRSELWAEIRRRCQEAGHPIMVMMENGPGINGVSDVLQHAERISDNRKVYHNARLLSDAAGHLLDRQAHRAELYNVEILYTDGTSQQAYRQYDDIFATPVDCLQICQLDSYIRHIDSDAYPVGYDEEMAVLRVDNVALGKSIQEITVTDRESRTWHLNWKQALEPDYYIEAKGTAPSIELHFPWRQQKGQYISVQLSCHDNGWEGFPLDQNPYAAQGSRWIMGYGCLLAPAVPVMMSGEEFNCDYTPDPLYKQIHVQAFSDADAYDADEVASEESRWLYANLVGWNQLERPEKRAMLEDTKRMLELRSRYDIIRPLRIGLPEENTVETLDYRCGDSVPIPYLYRGEGEAIAVAANPYGDRAVTLRLHFASTLGWPGRVRATVLFGAPCEREGTLEELSEAEWTIGRDLQAQGGLLVIRLEAAH